jgi:two-component system chemotaxis response regulator CheY
MAPKLLYVDSDAATRQLVTRVLASSGFKVVAATTVSEASEIAHGTALDVVLVDIDAAGRDVHDIIAALMPPAEGPRPLFLAGTADERPKHLARATAAGFSAVLVKPFDIDSLATDIRRHLPTAPVRPDPEADEVEGDGDARYRSLWTHTLAPLTANLVANVETSEGILVLLDETREAFVVAAAHSVRSGAVLPAPGTKIPRTELAWLDRALSDGESVVPGPEVVEDARLLPEECHVALVAPVTDNGRTYGLVVLGERRKRAFGLPPAQVAQCMAEAARVASVVRQFEQLDEAISERRRQIDEMRIAAVWEVAGRDGEPVDRASFVRLSARLGERLGLPKSWRPVLEYAHRVNDVGRAWLERAVLPLSTLPADVSQKLLDDHPDQTLEILAALDCPPPVIEVVQASRLPWNEREGDIGLAARVVAVVAAYEALTRPGDPNGTPLRSDDAVAEIIKASGGRFDPAVVEAFVDLVTEADRRAPSP